LIALVVSLCASGCSGAQGLVGSWKTETVRTTFPGRTNILESYQTVDFLKDGSFKMGSAVTTDGDKRTEVIFMGTYVLTDTNHVRLEVAANQSGPSNKIPLTVTFRIVGDELEMSKFISSVVPETQKYRRVKWGRLPCRCKLYEFDYLPEFSLTPHE
jgi:hypothetical protein